MCGICGFYSNRTINLHALGKMNDSMKHRGPDDSGVLLSETQNGQFLGLAQRRLSILDLSERGHQPMSSVDGRLTVVFNGEIYNYREIKQKLDYPFRSDCDTEVILASFLKWGIDCLQYFNGMYAIAIFDRDEQKLYLVRDRLGVKPLYYWKNDGGIVFASELKAIMLHPDFCESIDYSVLPDYFVKKYICSPNTIFENVYKIEPGSYMVYDGEQIYKRRYWSVNKAYNIQSSSQIVNYEHAKQLLKRALEESVRLRMIADVPIGLFLSGGYDSSLIAAVSQSVVDKPLHTFSIGFDDEKINEAKYAKAVADHIGSIHNNTVISENDMLNIISDLPYYYDEPFADGSQLPQMLVAKHTRDSGVIAVLTGDGGDEFFCGYGDYIPGIKNDFRLILSKRIRYNKVNDFILYKAYPQHKKIVNSLEKDILKSKNYQVRKMIHDMNTYLPDDICCKVDRATMRYSVEARCPFLDKDVVELSYRIPQEYKYHEGILKYILKELAYEYIPKELLDRPKQGFGIPYSRWLKGPLKEMVLDYCSEEMLKKQGIFDSAKINKLVDTFMNQPVSAHPNFADIIWGFLMFQMWYAMWVKKNYPIDN